MLKWLDFFRMSFIIKVENKCGIVVAEIRNYYFTYILHVKIIEIYVMN